MPQNPKEQMERRMREMPGIGCQIVLSPGPAARRELADRLEPILPPEWTVDSEFHRTTDSGKDLYFHTIETHNNRVPIPTLKQFGDKFSEVKRQQSVELAREESPEVFDEAIDALGRAEAVEMFGDIGISDASGLRIFARPIERTAVDVDADVFIRIKFGAPITSHQFTGLIKREFKGELVQVMWTSQYSGLLGGEPASTVGDVRQALKALDEEFTVETDESAIVCRVRSRIEG